MKIVATRIILLCSAAAALVTDLCLHLLTNATKVAGNICQLVTWTSQRWNMCNMAMLQYREGWCCTMHPLDGQHILLLVVNVGFECCFDDTVANIFFFFAPLVLPTARWDLLGILCHTAFFITWCSLDNKFSRSRSFVLPSFFFLLNPVDTYCCMIFGYRS